MFYVCRSYRKEVGTDSLFVSPTILNRVKRSPYTYFKVENNDKDSRFEVIIRENIEI